MVFSSLPFWFAFLPAVLLACLILPDRWRNGVLLAANLVFYAYGEPVYILLMAGSIAANYLFGRWLEASRTRGGKKRVLGAAVALNLLALVVFKYTGMITQTLHVFLPAVPVVTVELPIGISFYTFQALSYDVDVYRGECAAERNFVGFAAYISLFPQLIAGPIVRYADVRGQLRSYKKGGGALSAGVRLFLVGLAKKVLLANQFGILWQTVSANPAAAGTLCAWLGLLSYSLQLYFDFSGYSDMARGLGAMLGFDFCLNFNYPYISKSITEFWKRWHMSLSSWFRDYVYIPLGGSRRGAGRMCLNLLLTWLLTGLWHGAGWTFVFWGVYYGVLLMGEKLLWGKGMKKLPGIVQRAYTLLLVMIGWLFFASDSFGAAWSYLRVLFSAAGGTVPGGFFSYLPLLLLGCVAATPLSAKLWARVEGKKYAGIAQAALCLAGMTLCTACLVSGSYNPFLYFKF